MRDLWIVAAGAVAHGNGLGPIMRAALALPLFGYASLGYGHDDSL